MELILVRHGQPAWADPEGRARNDPGLSELGAQQAGRVADVLRGSGRGPIDAVVTSPAVRARETAAATEAALGLTADVLPWLAEIGVPAHWEGTPEQDVVAELGRMRQRSRAQWWEGNPGGERFDAFHTRVTSGLQAHLSGYGVVDHPEDPLHLWEIPSPGPRVVMFAHAGTNSVLISHLLGIEPQPWEWERFPCDHASVSVLRSRQIAGGAIWALEYFSDVAHLPPQMVSA